MKTHKILSVAILSTVLASSLQLSGMQTESPELQVPEQAQEQTKKPSFFERFSKKVGEQSEWLQSAWGEADATEKTLYGITTGILGLIGSVLAYKCVKKVPTLLKGAGILGTIAGAVYLGARTVFKSDEKTWFETVRGDAAKAWNWGTSWFKGLLSSSDSDQDQAESSDDEPIVVTPTVVEGQDTVEEEEGADQE